MAKSLKLGEGVPVIIDVLRSSSTIITALANNVSEVVAVNSKKEALELKKHRNLLAGEQNGVKLRGFDIGNSPTELLRVIRKKPVERLVLKTTNATLLLTSVPEAYVASTLNLETAKKELRGREVSIVAVGSKHGLAEDLAVAVALFSGLNDLEMSRGWVRENVLGSKAADHLRKIGYAKDVDFITNKSYKVLPKLSNGVIQDEIQT